MRFGVKTLDLMLALREPGCAVCRVRDQSERRYLQHLLWENVNDAVTRVHLTASLGYCPRHIWQLGQMEVEKFGDALGNSILYEDLARVVNDRLARYLRCAEAQARPPRWRWLRRLTHWRHRRPAPDELQPEATCRVCQVGAGTARANLSWLLEGLADQEPEFRDAYSRSDSLCLAHLRQALALAWPEVEAGALLLARDAQARLAALRVDLHEFADKHRYDRHDPVTDAEKVAWLKALRFFGGNEDSLSGHCPDGNNPD